MLWYYVVYKVPFIMAQVEEESRDSDDLLHEL